MAELFSTDYPLYSVGTLKNGAFFVAGGGGKAKTGIPNTLEIRRLENNDVFYFSDIVYQYDMMTDVIMQCTVNPQNSNMLAASINDECRIYNIKYQEESISEEGSETSQTGSDNIEELGSLDAKKEERQKENEFELHSTSFKKVEETKKSLTDDIRKEEQTVPLESDINGPEVEITEMAAAVTDKLSKEAFQNVVEFSCDGIHVLTGGGDGCIRIWELPKLEMLSVMRGHEEEITDIATHPKEMVCVSISRDCTAKVWNISDYNEMETFQWSPGESKYRFRACCFSNNEDENDFFSISIPVKWSKSIKQYCYLTKWDTEKWVEIGLAKTGVDMLTAITAHQKYIGVGDSSGGVAVYTTDLKLLYKVDNVHPCFVTDLSFISSPKLPEGQPLLLSVSIDRRCCITEIKKQGSWFKIMIIFAVLVIVVAIVTEIVMVI